MNVELLGLLLVFAMLALPILTIVALFKANALGKKLKLLEREWGWRLDRIEEGWRTMYARLNQPEEPRPTVTPKPVATASPAETVTRPRVEQPEPMELDEPLPEAESEPEPEPEPAPSQPVSRRPEPAPAPPPPRPPKAKIDWEIWLGARGAAVMGGILLALAVLFLFRYSIEQGLLSPAIRVMMGLSGSAVALVVGEILRKRAFDTAAAAVSGAGVTGFYASLWAAHTLYSFTGSLLTFLLMIGITVLCGWLSLRHNNMIVAFLGLAGGFATPLMVGSEDYNPLGLFGYLLLLNGGLLALARMKQWAIVAHISLIITFIYQLMHFIYQPAELSLVNALIILAFAAIFLLTDPPEGVAENRLTRIGAMLGAFLFTFILTARLGTELEWWKQSLMLTILCAGACFMANRQGKGTLAFTAAWAQLGVMAAAVTVTIEAGSSPWVVALWSVLPTFVFAALAFLPSVLVMRFNPTPAAISATVGIFILLIIASLFDADNAVWPWLCVWLMLSGILIGHAWAGHWRYGWQAAMMGFGIGMGLFILSSWTDRPEHNLEGLLATLTAGLLFLFLATRAKEPRALAYKAVTAPPLAMLVLLTIKGDLAPDVWRYPMLLAFAILAAFASLRGRSGGLFTVTMVFALFAQLVGAPTLGTGLNYLLPLLLCLATGILFMAGPLWFGQTEKKGFPRMAMLIAIPLWLLPLGELWLLALPDLSLAQMPIIPAMIAFGLAKWADRGKAFRDLSILMQASAVCTVVQVLPFAFGASGFATREWLIIGGGAMAGAIAVYAPRVEGVFIRYHAAVWALLASLALLSDERLGHFRPEYAELIPLLIDAGFLVPAIAFIVALGSLGRVSQPSRLPVIIHGVLAFMVIFIWLNQLNSHLFASGSPLAEVFDRKLAGDLSRSLIWAIYALVLMGIGIRKRWSGPRKAGLAMLVFTLAKVFLYDVSELTDLYRVASLLALAGSLLMVSLAYKKFVSPATESGEEAERNPTENAPLAGD